MAVSQGCFFFVNFGASIFLARLLSPYEMGIYAVAVAFAAVLSILQAAGLNGFIVREAEMTPALQISVFTMNAILSVVLAILIAIAGIFGDVFLHTHGVRQVFFVLALGPLIGIFEFLPAANIERAADFKTIAIVSSFRVVVTQGLSVALALAGFSFMSIAYGQLAGAACSAVAYCACGRRHLRFRLGLSEYRRVLVFGTQMFAISGINNIGTRLSDILLGRIVGISALGLYGRAASLNSLIQQNIYMVIVRVLFVDIAARVRAGESLRLTYLATIEMLTAILWPAFAGLAVLSGPVIRIMFGSQWVGAALPLVMLSIASCILATISLSWELFVVRQETARQAKIEFISTTASVLLFMAGCHYGLLAAASARVAAAVVTVCLYHKHMNRMTGTTTRAFLPIYGRSLVLTFAAISPALTVMMSHHWSSSVSAVEMTVAILAGMASWVIVVKLTGHVLAGEVTRIQKRAAQPLLRFIYKREPAI